MMSRQSGKVGVASTDEGWRYKEREDTPHMTYYYHQECMNPYTLAITHYYTPQTIQLPLVTKIRHKEALVIQTT